MSGGRSWLLLMVITLGAVLLITIWGLPPSALNRADTDMALVHYSDDAFYQSAGIQQVASPITPIPRLKKLAPDLQQKVDLGRLLFSDMRLSGNREIACISCHIIPIGGHDPRGISIGISDKRLSRNSPTVLNSAFNITQFWDGRVPSLHEQVRGPLLDGDEMGGKIEEIIPLLSADSKMVKLFSIYPQGITLETISDAISLYERTLITPDSPFDQYLLGDENAISETQLQGYKLFVSLGCISCHQGRNVGGNLHQRIGVYLTREELEAKVGLSDTGRFNITKNQEDSLVFKVPSLRNVARTPPYFHNGSRQTLEDAVRDMGLFQLGQQLSRKQIDLIVDFLRSLNGSIEEATE